MLDLNATCPISIEIAHIRHQLLGMKWSSPGDNFRTLANIEIDDCRIL